MRKCGRKNLCYYFIHLFSILIFFENVNNKAMCCHKLQLWEFPDTKIWNPEEVHWYRMQSSPWSSSSYHSTSIPKAQNFIIKIIPLNEEEEDEEDIQALEKSRSYLSLKTIMYSVPILSIPFQSAMVVAWPAWPNSRSIYQWLSFKNKVDLYVKKQLP